jgi:hypothetical protein
MKLCLAADDMRRTRIEAIAANDAAPLSECDRDLIVAAQHAVNAEGRRQVSRLRSFKNVLLVTAATLAIGAGGLAVLGIVAPQRLSWAGLLGYSQQLLTRFVDQRAQTVLDNFGRTRAEQQSAHRELDPTPTPT